MNLPRAAQGPVAIARGARTNLALLALLVVAFLTGWLAFAYATAPARWSLAVHALGGFAILALLPWKSMIARRGLRRPLPGRWASILLGVLVLVSLVAGLLHSTGVLVYIGPLTAMDFHVGAAIAAVCRLRFGTWSRGASASVRPIFRGATCCAAELWWPARPSHMPRARWWSGRPVCLARRVATRAPTKRARFSLASCLSAHGCLMRSRTWTRRRGGCARVGASGRMTSSPRSTPG